jgi:hypothetical protein
MAISTHFQTEVTAVDSTKTLVYVLDTSTYTTFQWSYSGLTVTGGSDLACEYGASALLEAMGFRWYTPNTEFWVRPSSISTGLSQAKTAYWMPASSIFLTYGHSWDDIYLPDRTVLGAANDKWQVLNGMRTDAWPAGHRWPNLINNNQAYFPANPNLITGTLGTNGVRFNLSATGSDYTNMVEIAAAEILRQGLNTWNKTNMDATDSDTQSSDLFWPFTLAVAAKVRSGTSAIGTHPIRAGVSTAQLGAYAYAGHRAEPTLAYTPGVYTQVALAFTPEDTWLPLVEAHGPKADAILLREYWAVNEPKPFIDLRHKTDYFDRYNDFEAEGAIGFRAESSAYWLNNLVAFRQGIRKAKTGSYTYAQALDDVMGDVFDDDPTVRELYEFWSDPVIGNSLWALRRSFDLVDEMATSWYKTYFMYCMVILAKEEYLPAQTALASQTSADTFPAAFSSLCSNVVAVNTNYPQLRMFAVPKPDWWNNPVLPTQAEFDSYHATLLEDTPHDAVLDSTDLILVRGITPRIAATTPATKFNVLGKAVLKFIGPGSVTRTVTDSTGTVTSAVTTSYAAGTHTIVNRQGGVFTHTGGHLFLDTFPAVRKDPDGTLLNHWLFIPTRYSGAVKMDSGSRVRFVDQNGNFDLLPVTHADYEDPSNLGTGQIAINNLNTRGIFYNLNANRYMSMHPTVALLPRAIAEEEATTYARVNI